MYTTTTKQMKTILKNAVYAENNISYKSTKSKIGLSKYLPMYLSTYIKVDSRQAFSAVSQKILNKQN